MKRLSCNEPFPCDDRWWRIARRMGARCANCAVVRPLARLEKTLQAHQILNAACAFIDSKALIDFLDPAYRLDNLDEVAIFPREDCAAQFDGEQADSRRRSLRGRPGAGLH
jgi:hypothetical protein